MRQAASVKRTLSALAAAFLLVFCGCVPAFAADIASEGKPTCIKVAFYPLDGFFVYDENGNESGYGVEYLNELKKYANIEWEFVPVDSWEAIREMLFSGEVDVRMPVTAPVDPASSYSSFTTEPILPSYHAIMTRRDRTDLYYQDYDLFPTLKIAVTSSLLEKTGLNDYLASIGVAEHLLLFDDYNSCRAALDRGDVDALISNVMDLTDDMKVLDKFLVSDCYITTLKDNPCYRLINDAMTELALEDPSFQSELFARCFPNRAASPFTREETEWIADTDHLTVAVRTDRKPVSYFDQATGSYKGIAVEIADEISRKLGIPFEYVPITTEDPKEMLETADLVMPVTGTDGNAAYFATRSILQSEILVAVRNGASLPETGGKLGVLGNMPGIRTALLENSSFSLTEFASNEDAMRALQRGEIDGFANASYVINWLLENPRYEGFHALHYQYLPIEYAICGKAENTCLSAALTKAILAVSAQTKNRIIIEETTFSMKDMTLADRLFAYRWQISAAGVTLVIAVLAVGLYIRSRNRYIREIRARSLEQERANHAKSDFLARMSHDLRTPMNGILGLTELMRDETADEKLLGDIGQLEISGKYLLNLINDTLDMSKIESGKLELRPAPIDSEAVFGNILSNASLLAQNKGVRLSVKVPEIAHGDWVPVMADAARLEQILMNLISNAVKFSPAGSTVEVIMETVSKTPREVVDRYVIRDRGIGMSPEFLPHLFEPFSQEGRSNTTRESGTGLGMPIVKQLVTLMNGEISVKSEVGAGTEVTVLLRYPVAAEQAAPEAAEETDELLLAGKRVLLCEDHPLNAQIASRLLEKKKVQVDHAENGEQGVAMFASSAPGTYDAILMDVRMPVMDGLEAARTIRALPRADAGTVPILAMTANAYEEDMQKSRAAGMNAHIAKPVEPKLLYQTLCRYMRP